MFSNLQKEKSFYILLAVFAVFLLEVNDLLLKLTTDIVSKPYIFFYKQMYVLAWFLIWQLFKKDKLIPPLKNKALMFFRCCAGVAMGGSYIFAFTYTTMGVVQASNMIHPLFVSLFAFYLLNEKSHWYDYLAIIVACIGTYFLININDELNIGAVFGTIGGVAIAFYIVLTRKLKLLGESNSANIFYLSLCFIVFGVIYALSSGDSYQELFKFHTKAHIYFCLSGLVYFLFLQTMITAVTHIKASTYAIIEYTSILWAMLFDYIFWNDVLTTQSIIGICFILVANITVIYYQSRGDKCQIN